MAVPAPPVEDRLDLLEVRRSDAAGLLRGAELGDDHAGGKREPDEKDGLRTAHVGIEDNRRVAEWRITGTYLEFCNCDPGCGCNFRGLPSSPEGNCQAVISHVIEDGSFDGVDLAGAKVSWALWWPGAIHDKGGRGRAYIDAEK